MSKIVFIEDESALQKSLGDLLRSEGHEVVSALNGEDGLRLALSESPDLILLDLVLPKRSGLDILGSIKEKSDTPVIILTNLEGVDKVDRALQLGATTYLVKTNYKMEDILEKIKEVLDEG